MKREVRYKYMPKDKKVEVKNNFKMTEYGKNKLKLLRRLTFEGMLCIIVGVLYFIFAFGFSKQPYDYGMGIVLMISGVCFVLSQYVVREREYDKFIAEIAKKKKSK